MLSQRTVESDDPLGHDGEADVDPAPARSEAGIGEGDAHAPGAAAARGLTGLIPPDFSIPMPGPGRLDRHRLAAGMRPAARLAALSTAAPQLPVALVGIAAAGWAAIVGLAASYLVILFSGAVDPGAPLASLVWLAAHHAPISTDSGTVSLLPLGLLVLSVLPLRRAGRFIVAQLSQRPGSPRQRHHRLRFVAGVALVTYAATAAVIAAADRVPPDVGVVSAVLWSVLIAAAAGSWGATRQARGALPRPPFVVAVAACVAVPLSLAVLLTVVSLALGAPAIVAAQDQLGVSGTEQVGLTLLQLAYLPNLVIWSASFVIGTGVSFGTDHRLSPFTSGEAVVPDLPVLAAFPADVPNSTALLPIAVALGGVWGAVVFARLLPEPRLRRRITRAVALALGSGAVWWVLVLMSGGSLGDGRLESVGPASGTVIVATLLTGAGTLLWALLPTLASDAKPVAVDLRERVSSAATAAKEATTAKRPSGKRG